MKTFPAKWNTAQLAFFVGLISGSIGIGELRKIIDGLQPLSASDSPSIYFMNLIRTLEPQIRADRWNGVVEHCERLFK